MEYKNPLIAVSEKTKEKLNNLKILPNETYESIVSRIIPKNLKIILSDDKEVSCYLWEFTNICNLPALNIYCPEEQKNIVIPFSIVKSIKNIKEVK